MQESQEKVIKKGGRQIQFLFIKPCGQVEEFSLGKNIADFLKLQILVNYTMLAFNGRLVSDTT
jgi:hypothetical protein